jgi:hypothetical protein
MAFEDLSDPLDRFGNFEPSTYTNALRPVMARPTMSVFISRVPS